jgi:hypothetical protein
MMMMMIIMMMMMKSEEMRDLGYHCSVLFFFKLSPAN